MDAERLLTEIAEYCRAAGMAESTFGRLSVNDGKLASRLRFGGRVTTYTVDRIRQFISQHPPGHRAAAHAAGAFQPMANGHAASGDHARNTEGTSRVTQNTDIAATPQPPPSQTPVSQTPGAEPPASGDGSETNFRFFDNRQKYLMFVNTCSEKWVVADRVSMELGNIAPRPPALRIFDAGVGDGTVLAAVVDDGVQVSRDGGAHWDNVTPAGLPDWIDLIFGCKQARAPAEAGGGGGGCTRAPVDARMH